MTLLSVDIISSTCSGPASLLSKFPFGNGRVLAKGAQTLDSLPELKNNPFFFIQ
jgi:hypothetical protein